MARRARSCKAYLVQQPCGPLLKDDVPRRALRTAVRDHTVDDRNPALHAYVKLAEFWQCKIQSFNGSFGNYTCAKELPQRPQ